MLNPEKIWHEYLTDLSISRVIRSHFTLGNSKKSFFNIIHIPGTSNYLRYLRRKQNSNCCTAALAVCLLLFSVSYYLHSPSTASGHATGAHVLIWTRWGLRQRLVATWAEFQHSVATTMWLIDVEKDCKHVLMQKVVTLNTACLTFQLPHITTSSFHSQRRQPTTGSLQSLQRLKERNKPSVRWKSFAIHKFVWWHFQAGWASGLQFLFFWDNINNQNYVWIILLKMTFWISSDRWGGQVCNIACQIFLGFKVPKIIKIG